MPPRIRANSAARKCAESFVVVENRLPLAQKRFDGAFAAGIHLKKVHTDARRRVAVGVENAYPTDVALNAEFGTVGQMNANLDAVAHRAQQMGRDKNAARRKILSKSRVEVVVTPEAYIQVNLVTRVLPAMTGRRRFLRGWIERAIRSVSSGRDAHRGIALLGTGGSVAALLFPPQRSSRLASLACPASQPGLRSAPSALDAPADPCSAQQAKEQGEPGSEQDRAELAVDSGQRRASA